jgi:hypothetical protein
LDPNKFLLEKLPRFHLTRTLRFSLLSFNECSLFLLLRLVCIFRLDFCLNLVIYLYQGVFLPLVHVVFHQKSWVKKVWMVLEKRKSFMQKVVQKGACLDCGLDFFMSCLMSFDSMLSDFCCSMNFLKWLRLLNEPLKKSCVVFIIWNHYFGFLLDALFGLTWRMLTHVRLIQSRHKPLWSFNFWLLMSFYASFNVALSLCMIMTVIALLVGRSQSFASPHFVLSMSSTRASNS